VGRAFAACGEREYERYGVFDTEVLVVFCDVDEKPLLIAMSEGALFTTPHYDGHGSVLIRLKDIAGDDLVEHLEESYLLKAPSSLRGGLGRVSTSWPAGRATRWACRRRLVVIAGAAKIVVGTSMVCRTHVTCWPDL